MTFAALPRRALPLLAAAAALVGGVGWMAFAKDSPRQPAPDGSYGFLVTGVVPAIYKGTEKGDCPDGRAHSTLEAYLATQTPAERIRLQKPENALELEKKYKVDFVTDDLGHDICRQPEAFDRAPARIAGGRTSFGMDLDGGDSANTCAHGEFQSPTGETGVDNQFYRVVGCTNWWRGAVGGPPGEAGEGWRMRWATGDSRAVVVLRGVDDWRNDDHVEFVLATSKDPAPVGADGKVIAGGSLRMTDNPRWRNSGTGRIRDGVLVTNPMEVAIYMRMGTDSEIRIRHARFRLKILPNGELDGMVAGYQKPREALAKMLAGSVISTDIQLECAALYKAAHVYADGDRDPQTGKCTTLSTAFEFFAKPAYVFEHDGTLIATRQSRTVRTASQ